MRYAPLKPFGKFRTETRDSCTRASPALFAYLMHMITQLVSGLTMLGFSERIAQAYVMLAQKGEISAREIGEGFSLTRSTAHDVMMALVQHGLARQKIDGKAKTFVLESPTVIREKLAEKKQECELRVERFDRLLPSLQALSAIGGGVSSAVKYVEGEIAVRQLIEEFARIPGNVLCLQQGADRRCGAGENDTEKRIRTMIVGKKTMCIGESLDTVRTIPASVLNISGNIHVCGDRVLLVSSDAAIEIRSVCMASTVQAALELAWCAAGKIEEWMK